MKDLLITWPKKRSLESYLEELERAARANESINFRVSTLPRIFCERCFIVYDGQVRGWNTVLTYTYRGPEEVKDPTGGFWPSGSYIVRVPYWHPIKDGPKIKGFQGYRYIERAEVDPIFRHQKQEKLPDWDKIRKSATPIAGHVMDGDWIFWKFPDDAQWEWHQTLELIAPEVEGDNADDAHVAFRVMNALDGNIYRLTVETLAPMLRLSPADKIGLDRESS